VEVLMRRSILLALTMVLACGGDDDPYADADPRCAAICQVREPELDGAYDVCSTASARSCVDQCEVRIAGTPTVCASCLLEGAEFDAPDEIGDGDSCADGTCTISGREGTCSYREADPAARDACIREVYPRREVSCEVYFRSVEQCTASCS
jgi:hypothetical protein